MKTLTPRRLKRLIQLTIFLTPLLIGVVWGSLKIFPQKTFIYQKQHLDQSTIIFLTDNTLALTPFNDFTQTLFDFSQIKIATPGSDNQEGVIEIKKGFAAAFYPLTAKSYSPNYQIKKYQNRYYLITESTKQLIPTLNVLRSYAADPATIPSLSEQEYQDLELAREPAGFLDGTLIQSADAIYVISGGRKMAVSSPQVMNQLQYRFEDAVPVSAAELRLHSNAPLPLTLNSAHPDGTILKDASQDQFYLVEKGERRPLSHQTVSSYYSAIHPIEIQFNPGEVRTCLFKNNTCRIKPDPAFKTQPGNSYLFQLPADEPPAVLKITFTRLFSWTNLQNLIQTLK